MIVHRANHYLKIGRCAADGRAPLIREAEKAGARTFREIADAFNARGYRYGTPGPMVCAECRERAGARSGERGVQ